MVPMEELRVGMPVLAKDGEVLGHIRTIYPHYILVGQPGEEHADLEVPAHAIARLEDQRVWLTVNRQALTPVDDEEALARRRAEGGAA